MPFIRASSSPVSLPSSYSTYVIQTLYNNAHLHDMLLNMGYGIKNTQEPSSDTENNSGVIYQLRGSYMRTHHSNTHPYGLSLNTGTRNELEFWIMVVIILSIYSCIGIMCYYALCVNENRYGCEREHRVKYHNSSAKKNTSSFNIIIELGLENVKKNVSLRRLIDFTLTTVKIKKSYAHHNDVVDNVDNANVTDNANVSDNTNVTDNADTNKCCIIDIDISPINDANDNDNDVQEKPLCGNRMGLTKRSKCVGDRDGDDDEPTYNSSHSDPVIDYFDV
jgi:hypothetical protein